MDFKRFSEILELKKNKYNLLKIAKTLAIKVINRLKYEKLEMFVFQLDLSNHGEPKPMQQVKMINNSEELLKFIENRAAEDKDCDKNLYYENIKNRFSNGDVCFAYIENEEIISVVFVTSKDHYISAINYLFKMPPKCVAFFDVYTLKAARGRGILRYIYNKAFYYLNSQGFERALIWFLSSNIKTLLAHKKVGFENAIKKIVLVQKFGIRKHRVEDVNLCIDDLIKNYKGNKT